jgi:fumarylacetoacetate (FAA) hydrolase family protein
LKDVAMPYPWLREAEILPADGYAGALAARALRPRLGPSVVAIRRDGVYDVTAVHPTMRDLAESPDPAAALRAAPGERFASLGDLLANTAPDTRDPLKPWLMAPVDLQAVKAAGVTFVASMLERVIEERARGNPDSAARIRAETQSLIGDDLRALKPGSEAAAKLKQALLAEGAWSQYLEVGIGPDAEIFTKAQPLSAVGCGMDAGVHEGSRWSNPEPETALIVASDGRIVGATLGNDVNLRDFEGRSALLLGKAKDQNASAALGPFVRFFDATFSLDDVRALEISLRVEGADGFVLEGRSSMAEISRDPADLVAQLLGPHHAYPDGAALYLGTMFAPTQDRDAPGQGFTHKSGDVVTIRAEKLGALVNRIRPAHECERWRYGAADLMRSLAKRRAI